MEGKDVVHQAITELRQMKEHGELKPTADIDMVWVVSAPGTYNSVSNDGIYAGRSADKERIDYGIELVQKITALRMKQEGIEKPYQKITREDIAKFGPILYYNGEDANTQNGKYLQNEALQGAAAKEDFPLPRSHLVIESIPTIGTPAQIPGLMKFLREHPEIKKVAVVTHAGHSRRVGRYVEEFKETNAEEYPQGVTFLNAWMMETQRTVGVLWRELRKVGEYATKGDLAERSEF